MKRLLFGVAVVSLLGIVVGSLLGAAGVNAAFLIVNRTLSKTPDAAAATLPRLDPATGGRALREAGYLALWAKRNTAALEAFTAAGWTTTEFEMMADHFDAPELTSRALAWYALVVADRPDDEPTWTHVAQRCQRDWAAHSICDEFLRRNDDNRLVNAAFRQDGLAGWLAIDAVGAGAGVAACDETPCARIDVSTAEASPAAGIFQCLQLVAGQTYHFSAWLKVATRDGGLWRPVYVQGNRAGQADGISIGDYSGARDWGLHEVTFTAPPFDDGLACFSPIRLRHEGSAWIRDPQVRLVEP